MTTIEPGGSPAEHLRRRLLAVAEAVGLDESVWHTDADVGSLLDALLRDLKRTAAVDRGWFLLSMLALTPPDAATLRRTMRLISIEREVDAAFWLLGQVGPGPADPPGVDLVSGDVVAVVDIVARSNLHTGIQRVARSVLPVWAATRRLQTVVWHDATSLPRRMRVDEHARVMAWDDWHVGPQPLPPDGDAADTLVVPWATTVVLTEAPAELARPLACLAEHSGNRLVAIGYDCIPAVSAHLLAHDEPGRFAEYLTIMKHARAVAAISRSAATEFAGFSRMLTAQGLPGPVVTECALPSPTVADASPPARSATVLCVGSIDPRKNQLALLHAAEVLWREGLAFELVFVGGGGTFPEFTALLDELVAAGRRVRKALHVTEDELSSLYAGARFSAFVSLHEGYGLPVVESLAHGTPVLASNFGSIAEIAAGGGTVAVDPRDDDAIVVAMRSMLTDDALIDRLRTEAAARVDRTWEAYADDLWDQLVGRTGAADV